MKTAEKTLQEATLLCKGTRLNKEGSEYKIMINAMNEFAKEAFKNGFEQGFERGQSGLGVFNLAEDKANEYYPTQAGRV